MLIFNMTGSVRSCCVPSCAKTRADGVILHEFPNPVTDKERFLTWVNAVGTSIASLEHQFIYRNRRVCHEHFAERYLTWSRKLSFGAVPTLGMPGFQVLRDITNINTVRRQLQNDDLNNIIASNSNQRQQDNIQENPVPEEGTEPLANLAKDTKKSSDEIQKKPISVERTEPVGKSTKDTKKSLGTKYLSDKQAVEALLKKALNKKDNYRARLKKAMKLAENQTFIKTMSKFTKLAAIFMTLQFREIFKNKMGRRFTQQEKIMALSLYKLGPKCYRLLQKAFVLPSPVTLSRLIVKADIRAGINEKLFRLMQKKVKNLHTDDKLCVLLFDEVALSPHFDYSNRKDIISGFVTNGKIRQNKIADHALVFMIRGVLRNYKQPIAYTFCYGSTKKEELAHLVKDVIRKLHSIGLRVLATVCDQGAANVSCINELVTETKRKYLKNRKEHKRNVFEVDDKEIIPIYDIPHLLKGIRNNFLEKNLSCEIDGDLKLGKWEHLNKLHEEDPAYSGIRLLKNLTLNHIYPEKCKMKVKYATQIFSQRVASTMGYLATKKILPEEAKQTADILLFFDELFDSCNGSYENSKKRSGKVLLGALTPKSNHSEVWAKAKKVLSSMKFVKDGKAITVPSIKNWLHTIDNFEYLRDVLFNKYQLKSIWMRHFNQDPLENFFGAIRSHGHRNINPSPQGFENAFVSLFVNNLAGTHSPGSNCEGDECSNMFKSMETLFTGPETNNTSQEIDMSYFDENIFTPFEEKCKDPRVN